MKKMSVLQILVTFMLFLVLVAGCLPSPVKVVKDVVSEYHALITAYQDAQAAAADNTMCLYLTYKSIESQTTIMNSYLVADVAKAQVYRESLATYGGKYGDQNRAFNDVADQSKSGNLDLGQLAAKNATPANMALTVEAYVTSFSEAPLAQVDPTVTSNTQRLVNEAYNQAFACVKDWNDAVRRYNIERNKIPGDVVGRIAEYLKVKELPESLPFYQPELPEGGPKVPTVSVGVK